MSSPSFGFGEIFIDPDASYVLKWFDDITDMCCTSSNASESQKQLIVPWFHIGKMIFCDPFAE